MLHCCRTFLAPHTTECYALYHGAFSPTVKLPMQPLPTPYSTSTSDNNKNTTNNKHTLVLDIDETLIHTFRDTKGDVGAMQLGVNGQPKGFEDVAQMVDIFEKAKAGGAPGAPQGIDAFIGGTSYFKFWTRPYLSEFLIECSELFNVVFWTAGTAPYMAAIINALERQVLIEGGGPATPLASTSYFYDLRKNVVDMAASNGEMGPMMALAKGEGARPFMRYHGYSRIQTVGQNYLKHIPLLFDNTASKSAAEGGKNMSCPSENVILIDDATRSFVFTPRSAIRVNQFRTRDDNDTLLRDVMPMLRAVASAPVATRELDHWRHDEYTKLDNLDFNMKKYLMASPSDMLKATDVHLGSYLPGRRQCGTSIPAARLHGDEFHKYVKKDVDGEVERIQGDYVDDATGFLHLFQRQQ